MTMALNNFLILSFICLQSVCFCFELISTGVTGVGVVLASASFALRCKFLECCDDNWIHFDERGFEEQLKTKLFGQHLAQFAVPKILAGFYRNKNPSKALVMSFHGLTGSGKNYISNMIANATYAKGTSSSYVHIYSGTKDFPHRERVSEYKDRLHREITRFTYECGRSLFIFDEIDKMPSGVLDSLKPYVDYIEHMDGIDYRKNIFIFLSNSGSSSITKLALEFWALGREREEITLKDMDVVINKGAFNEQGGLQYSDLLKHSLIDAFIPFLPLEKKHVQKCIEAELLKRGKHADQYLIKKIADQLLYFPEEEELYSSAGCKRIEQKIDLFV